MHVRVVLWLAVGLSGIASLCLSAPGDLPAVRAGSRAALDVPVARAGYRAARDLPPAQAGHRAARDLPAARAGSGAALDVESRVFLPAVARPPVPQQFPSDLHAARARYPGILGTELNHCRFCHVMDDRFEMNPYGRDYRDSQRNFEAVEPLDSDGDGYTNITEIRALTFPGWAASHPDGTP